MAQYHCIAVFSGSFLYVAYTWGYMK